MSNQVTVFIDYQNMATCAYESFPQTASLRRFPHIDPVRLAELIVSRRPFPSTLIGVRVYRGWPDPRRQRGAAAVNDIQASRWERDVEMSGWARRNGLWFPGAQLPWYHNLYERDYQAVCDDTDYLKDR